MKEKGSLFCHPTGLSGLSCLLSWCQHWSSSYPTFTYPNMSSKVCSAGMSQLRPSFLIQSHFWLQRAFPHLTLGFAKLYYIVFPCICSLSCPRLDWALLRADDAVFIVVSQVPVQYWSHYCIGLGGLEGRGAGSMYFSYWLVSTNICRTSIECRALIWSLVIQRCMDTFEFLVITELFEGKD